MVDPHLIHGVDWNRVAAPEHDDIDDDERDDEIDLESHRDKLEAALLLLPKVEQDVLILVRQDKPQREIAEIFGLTQPAISYRLRRACKRLRWIVTRPTKPATLHADLVRVLTTPQAKAPESRAEALELALDLSSQSAAAKQLGIDQLPIAHSFRRALQKLEAGPTLDYLRHYDRQWCMVNDRPILSSDSRRARRPGAPGRRRRTDPTLRPPKPETLHSDLIAVLSQKTRLPERDAEAIELLVECSSRATVMKRMNMSSSHVSRIYHLCLAGLTGESLEYVRSYNPDIGEHDRRRLELAPIR